MTSKWLPLLAALALGLTACQKEQVKEATDKAEGVADDVKAMRKMMESEDGRRKLAQLRWNASNKLEACVLKLPADRKPSANDCAKEEADLKAIDLVRKEQ